MDRGVMTTRGLDYLLSCVDAIKKVLGNEIDLACDCGPGWVPTDAIRFTRAVEPFHLPWLEDLITGYYTRYRNAQVFKDAKDSTTTPIHKEEELYLRENCKDLIEMQAVDVLGPDPEDVGGIAELKWIGEYADLHGISDSPAWNFRRSVRGCRAGAFGRGDGVELHRFRICKEPCGLVVRDCGRFTESDC
jgi:L-alanine-DL-glutamate epimerase-like enolase superfamily enzyme